MIDAIWEAPKSTSVWENSNTVQSRKPRQAPAAVAETEADHRRGSRLLNGLEARTADVRHHESERDKQIRIRIRIWMS